jgi:hypothetical protein
MITIMMSDSAELSKYLVRILLLFEDAQHLFSVDGVKTLTRSNKRRNVSELAAFKF